MKSLLIALGLLALTLDVQAREFGETVAEVGDLVVAAIVEGEGRSPSLEAPRCVDQDDEPTCVFRFSRDVWFEAVGDSAGLVNFVTFYAVPADLRQKTGTSFKLLTAALVVFSFEYRGEWQLASAVAGALVDDAAREGYSQISIDGREFSFEANGRLTIFVPEGDECDGCDEVDSGPYEGTADGVVETDTPDQSESAALDRAPTATSEIGPNFTLVLQSKTVVDLCEQSGFAANPGIRNAIDEVLKAALTRGIDPQNLRLEAENMGAFAMALVTMPYIFADPAERGRSEAMCDQAGQAAKLAAPMAISEVDTFR